MRTILSLTCLLALAAPAAAQNAYGDYHHGAADPGRAPRDHRRPPRSSFGNTGSSCANGDCRGLNSPGNIGGAAGDF